MPYKFVSLKWHLPAEYNRRIKLQDKDKEKIRLMYERREMSIGGIARLFGVHKRTIQFILFPDRQELNKKLRAERGGSKRYYDRERNRISQRDTQRYKQNIFLKLKGINND